tara:strand:+ start:2026 stop:2574 length:549 start_codon:yes stop_codon:yes gene_type:complete
MSRKILAVREEGYISKTDGTCWQVMYHADHSYYRTRRVQNNFPLYNANCNQATAFANQLGASVAPNPRNGFRVLQGVGFCQNHPEQMIVQVIRGKNIYKAVPHYLPNAASTEIWVLTEISESELAEYCGEEVVFTEIDDVPDPYIEQSGQDTFINQSISPFVLYTAGGIITLIALAYYVFKK